MAPLGPSSSAPQNTNRTALLTGASGPSCNAVSSTAATPDPASVLPGPLLGPSSRAPNTTTSWGERVLVCASTFREVILTFSASSTRRTDAVVLSRAAAALAPTTATGTLRWL